MCSLRGRHHALRRDANDGRDRLRLGHVNGVAALGLDDGRTGAFGHGALRVGGIILSSLATRYQLGVDLQAGSLIAPPRASTLHGTWDSAMNAAVLAQP